MLTLLRRLLEALANLFSGKAGRDAATSEMLAGQDALRVEEIKMRDGLAKQQEQTRAEGAKAAERARVDPNAIYDDK